MAETKEETLEDLKQEAGDLLVDYDEAEGIYQTACEKERFFEKEWRDATNRRQNATRRFKREMSHMREIVEKLKALDSSLFSPTAPEPWHSVYTRSKDRG
jgi:hypothetical protein